MGTEVDIRLLISVAAVLTLLSFAFLAHLLHTRAEQSHSAARWYGASLVGLLGAVASVFAMGAIPFALSAVLIIGGAHFGLIFAYLAFRDALSGSTAWRPIVSMALVLCLGQGLLALLTQDAAILMVSSSVINSAVGLLAAVDILRLAGSRSLQVKALLSLPFLLVGLSYLARLVLVLSSAPLEAAVLSTALIAFGLGVASLYWGFALIILREMDLNLQLREARKRAETMVQQRTRFFSQMNHEIRTPLNGIIGLSELLTPHLRGEEGAKLLKDLKGSGALLMSIVNEVLDFSKAEAGQVVLESLPIEMDGLLRSVVSQYQSIASSKTVDVLLNIDPPAFPKIMGDPTRLSQVLHNLLSNALKFTRTGEISISLKRNDQDEIELSVRDSGIGMTKEQLETLFLPFHQGSVDTNRRFGGTGLGMSIVKMLVDAMQAQVGVESRPGLGTTITLRLPFVEAAPERLEEAAETAFEPWREQCRSISLLCADDDHINRLVLQAILQSYGVDPVMAEDGYDAVRLACRERFDAYLIDISMPGMDGVETLATLREGDATRDAPRPMAIAVTANVMTEHVETYLAAGFDAHLPKPISREDLEAKLKVIIARNLQAA